jgi:hypothetical protein
MTGKVKGYRRTISHACAHPSQALQIELNPDGCYITAIRKRRVPGPPPPLRSNHPRAGPADPHLRTSAATPHPLHQLYQPAPPAAHPPPPHSTPPPSLPSPIPLHPPAPRRPHRLQLGWTVGRQRGTEMPGRKSRPKRSQATYLAGGSGPRNTQQHSTAYVSDCFLMANQ